jgi:hypothetical protein
MPATVTVSGDTQNHRVKVIQRDAEAAATDVGTTTYTDTELKSILGLDDKFIQAWKELFGGVSALQGYARGLSEDTTAQTKEQVTKTLQTDLETQYILHKQTYDAQHPGGLTGVMVSIGGAMYKVGGGAVKTVLAVPEFLAMLARTSTWVRVGEGILGMGCLVFGVILMGKELGVTDAVLPIGKLTSLIKKGSD